MKNKKTFSLIVVVIVLVIGFYFYTNKVSAPQLQNSEPGKISEQKPAPKPSLKPSPSPTPQKPTLNTFDPICSNGIWASSGCTPVAGLSVLKTYSDPNPESRDSKFFFWFDPQKLSISSSGDSIIAKGNSEVGTITIKKLSGDKVTDSNGHFGSVTYYNSNGKWYFVGTNEKDGSPMPPVLAQPLGNTSFGLPIFNGSILHHGFGAYVYIVATSNTSYLIISGNDTETLENIAKSIGISKPIAI